MERLKAAKERLNVNSHLASVLRKLAKNEKYFFQSKG